MWCLRLIEQSFGDPLFFPAGDYFLRINLILKYERTDPIRKYTPLYISSTLISDARLKLAKNQANSKQQHEAELLLFEN